MNRADRHDINPYELKLIRAGHYLWREHRRKGLTVSERRAIDAALETVWNAKKQLRAELAQDRKERGRAFAERIRQGAQVSRISSAAPVCAS